MQGLGLKLGIPVAIVGSMLAVATSTQAAMPVIDIRAIGQMAQQLQQLQQGYQMLVKQYLQLQQSYNAIAHLPQSATQQLGQQLAPFRTPLGTNSAGVNTMMSGAGLGQGTLGALQTQLLSANRIYSPTGTDFAARQLNRGAVSVAGSQAMASQLYQSAQDHVAGLQGIEGQLATAADAKAVADLQARASTEAAYIQAQTVQAQALAMWQQSQLRSEDQQRREVRRQQIDRLIAEARAHGAGA